MRIRIELNPSEVTVIANAISKISGKNPLTKDEHLEWTRKEKYGTVEYTRDDETGAVAHINLKPRFVCDVSNAIGDVVSTLKGAIGAFVGSFTSLHHFFDDNAAIKQWMPTAEEKLEKVVEEELDREPSTTIVYLHSVGCREARETGLPRGDHRMTCSCHSKKGMLDSIQIAKKDRLFCTGSTIAALIKDGKIVKTGNLKVIEEEIKKIPDQTPLADTQTKAEPVTYIHEAPHQLEGQAKSIVVAETKVEEPKDTQTKKSEPVDTQTKKVEDDDAGAITDRKPVAMILSELGLDNEEMTEMLDLLKQKLEHPVVDTQTKSSDEDEDLWL